MSIIVLIPCASEKLSQRAKARNLYTSTLFKLNLEYARQRQPDAIYILSAKYGLLSLDTEVEPYDVTLNNMSAKEAKAWAKHVLSQLAATCDLQRDHFILLAGTKYRQHLIDHLASTEIPLEGLSIGKQLQYLKQQTANKGMENSRVDNHRSPQNTGQQDILSHNTVCKQLHKLLNRLPRHNFPINMAAIPKNGIYVLFESGEIGHGQDRIVRVGTHTGKDQLSSRLKQHFVQENKDRSIFRKNIGRALLASEQDSFLAQWEIDLTSNTAKEQYAQLIDFKKQQAVEQRVTQYMLDHFSFVVFHVDDKEKRLWLESKLISTVSACLQCVPSVGWLGRYSPKDKIRVSGLWLVNELYKSDLTQTEFDDFAEQIGAN